MSPKSKLPPHHHSSRCCAGHLDMLQFEKVQYELKLLMIWNSWCFYGHLLSAILEIIYSTGFFYQLLTFRLPLVFLKIASGVPSQMLYLHFTNNHDLLPCVLLFQIAKIFSSGVAVLDKFLSFKSVLLERYVWDWFYFVLPGLFFSFSFLTNIVDESCLGLINILWLM